MDNSLHWKMLGFPERSKKLEPNRGRRRANLLVLRQWKFSSK